MEVGVSEKYLARFRSGTGAMGSKFIDFYECKGEIIRHRHEMGGQDKRIVKSIPDSIDGYRKIDSPGRPTR